MCLFCWLPAVRRSHRAVGLLSQNHHVQVSANRSAPAAGTNADNMGRLDERMCVHEASRPSSLPRTGRAQAPGRDYNPTPIEELPTRKVTTPPTCRVICHAVLLYHAWFGKIDLDVQRRPCTCRTIADSMTHGFFWFTESLSIRRSQVVHGVVRLGVLYLTLLPST
jgi:hypothetical protein